MFNLNDFLDGNSFDAYDYFGASVSEDGVIFRVYAPKAKKVSLVGDFSSWEELKMSSKDGVWQISVKNAKSGDMYKYRIYSSDGSYIDHCDPYGFAMELRPRFASIVTDLDKFKWTDESFMANKSKCFDKPLNIYEMHLGSWMMKPAEKIEDRWHTYEELASMLPDYLVEQGYNCVEFMPLSEHPVDISWGYQNTGFFSPTSRYGTPYQLNTLIDALHARGIYVLMDFVPVHFATDNYALINFDGTPLYENIRFNNGYSEWGSMNFDFSKGIVRSFLQSCASYWMDVFHFDGMRIDAVSRMIYYNGNSDLGINQAGIDFVKNMNKNLQILYPNNIIVAEDSTDYPKVTTSVDYGGLGFDYKWDMGWMNDSLDFFKKTSSERSDYYNTISFSIMYFYSENFMLALSHDENVHGKATVLNKMHGGDFDDKFSQGRVFYMYMMTHPGKKLNFMGSEFGQLREWNEEQEQDWLLLKYPIHDSFNQYIKRLNHLYLDKKSLHKDDFNYHSFRWIVVNDHEGVTFAYTRQVEDERIFVALNFSENDHRDYHFRFDRPCKVIEILNSDWDIYSGKTRYEEKKEYQTFTKIRWEHENTERYLKEELENLKEKIRMNDINRHINSEIEVFEKNLKEKMSKNDSKNSESIRIDRKYIFSKDEILRIESRIEEIEKILEELKDENNSKYYEYILSLDINRYSGRMFEVVEIQ